MVKQQSARWKLRTPVAVLLLALPLSAQTLPQSSAQQPTGGVTVDPSAPPLQPNIDSAPQQQQSAPLPQAPEPATPPPQQQRSQPPATPPPLGAAAAEEVPTAGGGVARPAGNAIAPVQQHRYRSLVIKLGALAAAGVAIGTVYGLSRATPSVPPHSASSTAARLR